MGAEDDLGGSAMLQQCLTSVQTGVVSSDQGAGTHEGSTLPHQGAAARAMRGLAAAPSNRDIRPMHVHARRSQRKRGGGHLSGGRSS